MTAVRLIIKGRVQGVGYRYWTTREATARGLDGWVRNLPDGSVEALLAGPAAAVADMVQACRKGPALASVTSVDESLAEPPGSSGFREIR